MDIKSQSAMEYLMTYGWAILIIAIVLGTLYQLGVFTSASLTQRQTPGSCEVFKTATGASSLAGLCQGELPQYVATMTGSGSMTLSSLSGSGFTYSGSDQPVTITAWVNPSKAANMTLVGQNTYNSGSNFLLYLCTPGVSIVGVPPPAPMSLCASFVGWNFADTQPIDPNVWTFVAIVHGSNPSCPQGDLFYVNGVAGRCTNDGGGFYSYGSNPALVIGGSFYDFFVTKPSPIPAFSGMLADVQLYNTTLSSSEVQALYNGGIGAPPVRPTNIVGWWPLNQNSNDYSGNLNNPQTSSVSYTSFWTNGYQGRTS